MIKIIKKVIREGLLNPSTLTEDPGAAASCTEWGHSLNVWCLHPVSMIRKQKIKQSSRFVQFLPF